MVLKSALAESLMQKKGARRNMRRARVARKRGFSDCVMDRHRFVTRRHCGVLCSGGKRPSVRPIAAASKARREGSVRKLYKGPGCLPRCKEGHLMTWAVRDGRKHGQCDWCWETPANQAPILLCQECKHVCCVQCERRPKLPLPNAELIAGPPVPAGGCTVILCPGGNYEFLCPSEGLEVADWLAEQGIRAYTLRYRMLPKYGHEDALNDLDDAVRAVRQAHGGPVVGMGFSAGGHLVTAYSLHEKKSRDCFDAQVAVYPCIDSNGWASPNPDENCFARHHVDRCFEKVPEMIASRDKLFGGRGFSAPPTFLVGCVTDDCCPVERNTDIYAKALTAHAIPHVYVRRDIGGHGAGVVPEWSDKMLGWLRRFTSTSKV